MPQPFWVILEDGHAVNLRQTVGLEIETGFESNQVRVHATDDMSDETYSHGRMLADCASLAEAKAFIRRLLEKQAEGGDLVTAAAVLADVRTSNAEPKPMPEPITALAAFAAIFDDLSAVGGGTLVRPEIKAQLFKDAQRIVKEFHATQKQPAAPSLTREEEAEEANRRGF
jgi:hypothetical protein